MVAILVADADDAIRESLCEFLAERCGYETIQASTAAEVRGCIASGHFNAAIMDLRLRGATFDDLRTSLRERFPLLPIIVFTGSGICERDLDDDRSLHVLYKPLPDLGVLHDLLQKVLETRVR